VTERRVEHRSFFLEDFSMSICSKSISHLLVFFATVGAGGVSVPGPLPAQPQQFESSISGVVTWEGGGSIQGFQVELNDRTGRQTSWADVRPDGTFEIPAFEAVSPQYILQVWNRRGQLVHRDIVQPQALPLEIHLSAPEQERPITGLVSAEDLLNKIPKKAMREFTRAQKAAEKGEAQRGIRHLRKAIQIHPRFVEAHNSLGAKYMMLGDYEQAAAAFEEALRLRPDRAEPLSNLGMALHGLKRYEEAERLIRRALELRPRAVRTRFALALVLSSQVGKEEEALRILTEVAAQLPEAHFYAAVLLNRRTDLQGMAREVRAYLDSGDNKHREMAERWLRSLQSQTALRGSLDVH
jgi:tetratricopeptide (TPR) repeat protein